MVNLAALHRSMRLPHGEHIAVNTSGLTSALWRRPKAWVFGANAGHLPWAVSVQDMISQRQPGLNKPLSPAPAVSEYAMVVVNSYTDPVTMSCLREVLFANVLGHSRTPYRAHTPRAEEATSHPTEARDHPHSQHSHLLIGHRGR